VSVGPNGKVAANISARDVVVMGKVRGNIAATDRVEVRVEGSLTGDVTTARISIEDGAYFKGGIDIRKSERKGEFRSGPAGQADAPRLSRRKGRRGFGLTWSDASGWAGCVTAGWQ